MIHMRAHNGHTFLSTLSLRRATALSTTFHDDYLISIHALLAESDNAMNMTERNNDISIHALLAESDPGASEQRLLF